MPGTRARRQPRRGRCTRLATAGAAIAVAAAVVLAVVLVNTQHQLNQARQQLSLAQAQLQAITAVQTAADAKVITKPTSVGGIVTVTSSAAKRQLVLRTAGLPALPAGKVYQLWLIGRAATRPARKACWPPRMAGAPGPSSSPGSSRATPSA